MPSASPEVRAAWPGGDAEAIQLLKRCGWTMDPPGTWQRPIFAHVISDREYSALEYLIFEWDYSVELYPAKKPRVMHYVP
jgi:hypothetical protein